MFATNQSINVRIIDMDAVVIIHSSIFFNYKVKTFVKVLYRPTTVKYQLNLSVLNDRFRFLESYNRGLAGVIIMERAATSLAQLLVLR